MTVNPPERPDPSHMRASDGDRDRIADQLREALAEGRLTPEEHGERLDAVYAAKTYADLAAVIEDLPAAGGGPPVPPSPPPMVVGAETGLSAPPTSHLSANMVAIFSGADRKGRWLVEPTTNVLTVFGGFDFDLREAVLSQREVTINVVVIFGGGNIIVPPGVRVVNSTASIFSGVDLPPDDTDDPEAPVIRITGLVLFGGVAVKRRPARGRGRLRGSADSGSGAGSERVDLDDREERRELRRERRESQELDRERRREYREMRREEREARRDERRGY